MEDRAGQLREAIENLINVKLHDALVNRNGIDRLIAHRSSGVASFAVRQAENHLQAALTAIIPSAKHVASPARGG